MFDYLQKAYIQKNKNGRRFAIGDIHGCYKTLKYLLFGKIQLQPDDQIFLLGDFINRGPRSKKVLNLIINLLKRGYHIYPLRGNHEEVLIKYIKNDSKYLFVHLKQNSSIDLLNNKFQVRNKHILFLDTLPYYYILDNFLLVHAGFDFSKKKPFDDKTSMVWIRKFKKNINKEITGDRIIIHGHQKKELEKIQKQISKKKPEISLENAVYEISDKDNFKTYGNLLALNLDTFELLVQPNIDFKLNDNGLKIKK